MARTTTATAAVIKRNCAWVNRCAPLANVSRHVAAESFLVRLIAAAKPDSVCATFASTSDAQRDSIATKRASAKIAVPASLVRQVQFAKRVSAKTALPEDVRQASCAAGAFALPTYAPASNVVPETFVAKARA